MQTNSSFFVKAAPLLLILFIDGMGLGLVIPILNGLIFDEHSAFLATALSPLMHNVIYGGIIGIFMLCWFFGAAILGDLSDQIGRKKSLLICLGGGFFSYLISGISVSAHSLSLLIIGRIIAGVTSGSQPIAQAAIIDISHSDHKARNIGYILLALSLGFIVGPLLGGVLSDNRLVSWFDFSTPFYFAAILALFNILLLFILFNETFVAKHTTFAVNPYQAISIFISAFKNERVKKISFIYLIYIFGWSSFYSFISIFLLSVYHFTPTEISLFMAVMGVGFAIGNGFLVNYLAKFFSLRVTFIYCNVVCAIFIFLMLLVQQSLFNWLIMAPLACAVSVAYAAILTIFSNQVDEKSQGWVMGITGSIMAFVWAINGIIVGVLASLNPNSPLWIAAISLLLAATVTGMFYKAV